jgi:hypothetical protein
MITNVWLKSQPGKKIRYPDCIIETPVSCNNIYIINVTKSIEGAIEASYLMREISRIEFRP